MSWINGILLYKIFYSSFVVTVVTVFFFVLFLLYDVIAGVLFLLSYLFSQYFAVQYMLNLKGKYMKDLCL